MPIQLTHGISPSHSLPLSHLLLHIVLQVVTSLMSGLQTEGEKGMEVNFMYQIP